MVDIAKLLSKEVISLARSGVRGLIKSAVKDKWRAIKHELSPAEIEQTILNDLHYLTTFYTVQKYVNKDQEVKYRLSAPFVLEWLQNSPSMADRHLLRDEESGQIWLEGHPITNAEKMEIVKLISSQTKTNSTALMGYLNVALTLLPTQDYTALRFKHQFAGWDPNQPSIIDSWLRECFQLDDPYATNLFRKWMIGTTNRIISPGCAFDGCLTIQGPGGVGKTSFLRNLLPEPFSQRTGEIYCNPKNAQKFVENILGKSISIFDELEVFEQEKTIEIFKQLISSQNIDVRLPYRRDPQRFALRCGFGATTNREKFLPDPFVSRRMWVIKLGRENRLNFEYFFANRENLWKEALYLAEQKTSHFLSPTEQPTVEEHNQQFLNN